MIKMNEAKSMYKAYFEAASTLVAVSLSMKLVMFSDGFSPEEADEMIASIGDDVREAYELSRPFKDAQKVFDGTMSMQEYTLNALNNLGGKK